MNVGAGGKTVARALVGLSANVATNSAMESNPGIIASHMMGSGSARHAPEPKGLKLLTIGDRRCGSATAACVCWSLVGSDDGQRSDCSQLGAQHVGCEAHRLEAGALQESAFGGREAAFGANRQCDSIAGPLLT